MWVYFVDVLLIVNVWYLIIQRKSAENLRFRFLSVYSILSLALTHLFPVHPFSIL